MHSGRQSVHVCAKGGFKSNVLRSRHYKLQQTSYCDNLAENNVVNEDSIIPYRIGNLMYSPVQTNGFKMAEKNKISYYFSGRDT